MKVEIGGGGDLPEGLKEMLGQALGRMAPKMVPARMDQIRHLLETNEPFKIGDIVQLREGVSKFKWPTQEHKCIVTQVLDQPFRCGESGTSQPAKRLDMAIAFVDENDGEIAEYLHDSREFVKVGSIYDPVKLADGEELPVV